MPSIDLSQYKAKGPPRKVELNRKVKGNGVKAAGEKGDAFSWSSFLNKDISFGKGKIGDKKKEAFYMELSTLLTSGIDLKTALDLILVDQDKAKEKALFADIKDRVLHGSSLSDAMKSTSRFTDYEYYSIRIGEETGRIGEVLTDLGKYYKTRITQKRKIISAVTYPVIVLMTSLGAVFFMLKFVVPMFADVFQRFGGHLPWITSMIIRFSAFTDKYFSLFILVIIAASVFIFVNKDALWFRKALSSAILKIPLAGDIVRKIYLARFANTMRLLVSTDTPLLRSISLVRQMIGFYPLETTLADVEQSILKGESLHESLSRFDFYPSKLVQLLKVGEEVNRLDYFFGKVSEQYTEEVEYKTGTISSLLEPLIIIFLGLVVGLILIAMYLPMFQLSNSF